MRIAARVRGAVAAAVLVALSGCGSSDGGPGSTPSTPSPAASSIAAVSTTGSPAGTSATVVITITNFAYQGPDSVSPGSTVTVKNEDSQAHTVTSDLTRAGCSMLSSPAAERPVHRTDNGRRLPITAPTTGTCTAPSSS